MTRRYSVVWTPTALKMLASLVDRRVITKLIERAEALAEDPEHQGHPLWDVLKGYRSVRVLGQRYRIIYKVQAREILVVIVGAGLRKEGDRGDIYAQLHKLFGKPKG